MGVRRGVSGKYRRSLGAGAKSPKIGDHGGGKRRGEEGMFPLIWDVLVGSAASIFFACVRGLQARSLWALLRPLPGKPFPNEWDFCFEACVPQDRDRFVFGDFVVVIA